MVRWDKTHIKRNVISCTEYMITLAASGAGIGAAWHHKDDLLSASHELHC